MPHDWVFITDGGSRWHLRGDCEALADGQQAATDLGMTAHPIQQVPPQRAGSRTACLHCGTTDFDVPQQAKESGAESSPETRFERLFQEQVLGALPEVTGWKVQPQKRITVGARTYRVDFALTSGPLRVAIEIDGENKGARQASHDEWTRRQTALVSDGWEVLRFTNRDVVNDKEYCRRQVAMTIARLRERRRLDSRPTKAGSTAASFAATAPASLPLPAPSAPDRESNRGLWLALAAPLMILAFFAVLAIALSSGSSDVGSADGSVAPTSTADGPTCPGSHPVKGNVNQEGERIFHRPSGEFYDATEPERCFADAAAAVSSGFRASRR
jgi:very-short-patch-repair endonuclease